MRLHIERAGRGEPAILSHGLASSTDTWRHQIGALAQSMTVIAWDLPGHGRSERTENPDDDARYHGAGDYMQRKMPGARQVRVSGGGHDVHEEAPDGVNAAILAFLSEL